MSEISSITDQTFETEVLKSTMPVLVDFWAPWCGPCKMLAPVIEKVSTQYTGKIKFVKLNTDENPTTAGSFQISGIPSLLLFKSGQVIDRKVGFIPEKDLTVFLARYLG